VALVTIVGSDRAFTLVAEADEELEKVRRRAPASHTSGVDDR
jgi:hypothetical protein